MKSLGERARAFGRALRERVAPIPGRVLIDAVYLALVIPYGLAVRALGRRAASPATHWRAWKRTSDSLESARRRY